MDFAIIETGGKQYKITPTTILSIEKLEGKAGDTLVFDKVLMVVDGEKVEIGTPYVEGASVEAVIEDQGKGKKIHIRHYRHKVRWRKHIRHRQLLTTVDFAGKKKAAKKEAVKAEVMEAVKVKSEKVKTEAKKEVKVKSEKAAAKKPTAKANTKTSKTTKTVKKTEK